MDSKENASGAFVSVGSVRQRILSREAHFLGRYENGSADFRIGSKAEMGHPGTSGGLRRRRAHLLSSGVPVRGLTA